MRTKKGISVSLYAVCMLLMCLGALASFSGRSRAWLVSTGSSSSRNSRMMVRLAQNEEAAPEEEALADAGAADGTPDDAAVDGISEGENAVDDTSKNGESAGEDQRDGDVNAPANEAQTEIQLEA